MREYLIQSIETIKRLCCNIAFMMSNTEIKTDTGAQTFESIMEDIEKEGGNYPVTTDITDGQPIQDDNKEFKDLYVDAKDLIARGQTIIKNIGLNIKYGQVAYTSDKTLIFLTKEITNLLTVGDAIRTFFMSDTNTNEEAKLKVRSYEAIRAFTETTSALMEIIKTNPSLKANISGPMDKDFDHWALEYVNMDSEARYTYELSRYYDIVEEALQYATKLKSLTAKMVIIGFEEFRAIDREIDARIIALNTVKLQNFASHMDLSDTTPDMYVPHFNLS